MATLAGIKATFTTLLTENISGDVEPEDVRDCLNAMPTLDALEAPQATLDAVAAAGTTYVEDNNNGLVDLADKRTAMTATIDAIASRVTAVGGTVTRAAADALIAAYGVDAPDNRPAPPDLETLLAALMDEVNTWVLTIPETGQEPAAVVISTATVAVDRGTTAVNGGDWYGSATAVLTASIGVVTQLANNTWTWTYAAKHGDGQTVTMTLTDGATVVEETFVLSVSIPAAPASLATEVGASYDSYAASHVAAVGSSPTTVLLEGQQIIETYLQAWMATGTASYLDKAIQFAEDITAAAVDGPLIDGTVGTNGELPEAANGAIDAGVAYKEFASGSSLLAETNFGVAIYRLVFEVFGGVMSGDTTITQQIDTQALYEWAERNITEKWITTTNNNGSNTARTVERAASRNISGAWWDDKITHNIIGVMSCAELPAHMGLTVKSWVASYDWQLWIKTFLGVGPAVGAIEGEDLDFTIEYVDGVVYWDRNNVQAPTNYGGVHSWDTGHAGSWVSAVVHTKQLGAGDTALTAAVDTWLTRLGENALAICQQDGTTYSITHWMDGVDEVFVDINDHTGFTYHDWYRYMLRHATMRLHHEEFYDLLVAWDHTTGWPDYSQSLARNDSTIGRAAIASMIALANSGLEATDIGVQ